MTQPDGRPAGAADGRGPGETAGSVRMSKVTLLLFKELMDQVMISPRQPDFEEAYSRISLAKRELDQALREMGG